MAWKVTGSEARAGWEGCGSVRVPVGVGGERFGLHMESWNESGETAERVA